MTQTSFNKLTDAEVERLACLAEECGEVIQAVGKILRHGYADYSPNDPTHTDNRKLLEKELGDVRYWIDQMSIMDDISVLEIYKSMKRKAINVPQWLHHQEA